MTFLTVAIPSLNGARFIEETISSLINQCQPHMNVEILVMENHSSDNTLEICRELQRKTKVLRIATRDSTVSFDTNVAGAVREASGQYVWIMADDDVAVPGALNLVYEKLSEHEPSNLLMSFRAVGEGLEDRTGAPTQFGPEISSDARVALFEKSDDALLGASFDVFGLLSVIVVDREIFLEEAAQTKLALPDGFEFLYLVPKIMQRGLTVFIEEPLVLFRQYKKRWETSDDQSQSMTIFFVVIPTILNRLAATGYSKATINWLSRHHLANLTHQLIPASQQGMKYRGTFFKAVMRANYKNLIFWIQVPVFLVPKAVLKKLDFIYKGRLADFLRGNLTRQVIDRSSPNSHE